MIRYYTLFFIVLSFLSLKNTAQAQISFSESNVIRNNMRHRPIDNKAIILDVNDDGFNDLVYKWFDSTRSEEVLAWARNDGNGNFTHQNLFFHRPPIQGNNLSMVDYMVSDVDNDGKNDVIMSVKSGDGACYVLFNRGAGVFARAHVNSNNTNALISNNQYHVASGNLDNDSSGYEEIIIINTSLSSIGYQSMIMNNGSIDFAVPTNYLQNGNSDYGFGQLSDIEILDINSDGFEDIAMMGYRGSSPNNISRLSAFINDGSGNFTESSFNSGLYPRGGTFFKDVDGDGNIDAIVSNNYGAFTIFKGTGSAFSPTNFMNYNNFSLAVEAVEVDDIDLDGDTDLVIGTGGGNLMSGSLFYMLNDGLGNFGSPILIHQFDNEEIAITDIKLANIDGDSQGRLDIICAGTKYSTTIFYNTSTLSDENNKINAFALYPNPSKGRFTVNSKQSFTSLKITDLSGRLVAMYSFTDAINKREITTDQLNSGVYLVTLEGENTLGSQRLVVE